MNNIELKHIDENKGLDFEKFVVSRFDEANLSLYNWQGDKSYKDVYPETNKNPDLIYKIKDSGSRSFFAVECKWRRNDENGLVPFARHYQLENYQQFVERMRIKLFIVLGLCGKPSSPANLFVIPFEDVNGMCFLDITMLRLYQRSKNARLYWDEKRHTIA